MHDLLNYFRLEDADILLRILLSIVLGSCIGLEREITNKSAGLRTQMMVCMGSCIFTILSITGFSTAVTLYPIGDPSRVAAQIITGIGFIGAGTVMRQGFTVTGLTTAASLWIVAAIGMACGCGKYGIAVVSTLIAVVVLVLIRIFELRLLPGNLKHFKKIKISFTCNYEDYEDIYKKVSELFPDIAEYTQKTIDEDGNKIKVNVKVLSNEKNPTDCICKKMENVKNMKTLSVKEIFD